jgi:hypothetical protein
MIKITFTRHALQRLKERGLSEKEVKKFITNPDKIAPSLKHQKRFLIKKIYWNQKLQKDHLLLIIVEKENSVLKVITVIDTSKISKYF